MQTTGLWGSQAVALTTDPVRRLRSGVDSPTRRTKISWGLAYGLVRSLPFLTQRVQVSGSKNYTLNGSWDQSP